MPNFGIVMSSAIIEHMPLDHNLANYLELALEQRIPIMDEEQRSALRLFAGFYEGDPTQQGDAKLKGGQNLVADLYAQTLVLFDYAPSIQNGVSNLKLAQDFYLSKLPWINCVVQKHRNRRDPLARRGRITFGESPANQINEHGIKYALDLLLNQDASFYIDTRNLRHWLIENAVNWQVLNTFAYTGSLGVAALAGGAKTRYSNRSWQKVFSLGAEIGDGK